MSPAPRIPRLYEKSQSWKYEAPFSIDSEERVPDNWPPLAKWCTSDVFTWHGHGMCNSTGLHGHSGMQGSVRALWFVINFDTIEYA